MNWNFSEFNNKRTVTTEENILAKKLCVESRIFCFHGLPIESVVTSQILIRRKIRLQIQNSLATEWRLKTQGTLILYFNLWVIYSYSLSIVYNLDFQWNLNSVFSLLSWNGHYVLF